MQISSNDYLLIGIAGTLVVVVLSIHLAGHTTLLAGIQAMGSVAIAVSAFVAYRLFRANVQRHTEEDGRAESKTYLDESLALLERAYETFTRHGENPPANNRLLWFSTARMIVRYRKMKARIGENDHKAIADETEEYVRLRFSSLLRDANEALTLEYFMPDNDPYHHEVVSRKAIAVVFDFAKWPDGMIDPLDEVNDVELFARGAVPLMFPGVEAFIFQYPAYWERIENLKEEIGD